jgi:glycosyltransferase involved in cell wall biosynthesis
MLNLAIGFADAGYPVDLVLAVARGPYLPQVPPSVNLVDLKARDVAFALPALARYLKTVRPVGMVSALSQANVNAVLARWASRADTRIVLSTQNFLSVEARNGRSLKLKAMPYFVRAFFPHADVVAGNSTGVSDDLAELVGMPRARVPVLYNAVVSNSTLSRSHESVDHPWFVAGQPPVILTVGRLHPQKDHTTLLKAFAQVRSRISARLMILGEGELRPELETLAASLNLSDDVSMPGFVENPYAYMARAGVFALSSRWEGLPTVLIEAMACGAPVVSTDCPSGPREILDGGRYGALVPMNDPTALAHAIVQTLETGRNAPPVESWEPYRISVAAQKYVEVLTSQTAPVSGKG